MRGETRSMPEIFRVAALLLLGSLAAVRLMALPVFEDEASQLHLTERIVEAREWLAPLADGKPLEAWLMVPFAWLDAQPLWMIRALHVLAGMIGAVLTYRLALLQGGSDLEMSAPVRRRVAFTSGVLFAICPFVVYLQRLALSDILMCTAGTGVLLAVGEFIRAPTRHNSRWVAVTLVLAAFCKMPVGFVYLISMPVALALLPSQHRRQLLSPDVLSRVLAAHAPALVLALAVVGVAVVRVRSGHPPGFGLADFFGVGLGQYRGIAAAIGIPRPRLLTELTAQLTWPVVLIGLIGIAVSVGVDRGQRWLVAMGALPMLAIGLLASFWYSRYLLFTLPPLIIASVSGWQTLGQRLGAVGAPLRMLALAVCVALMGWQSALLILDPAIARWSPLDRFQYFEGWGSGFGYPQAAQFLLAAQRPPAKIFALDGHSAYQLDNYLPAQWHDRVGTITYGPDGQTLGTESARLENLLSRTPVWIISAEPLLERYLQWSFGPQGAARLVLHPVAEFDKPGAGNRLGLYEVTPRS